jgi:hypothetical protein
MPLVGFEPTIPVFERAKTVYALDRAAPVVGFLYLSNYKHGEILSVQVEITYRNGLADIIHA